MGLYTENPPQQHYYTMMKLVVLALAVSAVFGAVVPLGGLQLAGAYSGLPVHGTYSGLPLTSGLVHGAYNGLPFAGAYSGLSSELAVHRHPRSTLAKTNVPTVTPLHKQQRHWSKLHLRNAQSVRHLTSLQQRNPSDPALRANGPGRVPVLHPPQRAVEARFTSDNALEQSMVMMTP